MTIECEIKLRGDREDLIAALVGIGARPAGARALEDDVVFDTEDGRILREGGVLRLRRCRGRAVLTLKGPPDPGSAMKVQRELETRVSNAAATRAILEGLGFSPALRYQKYRTRFTCPVEGCDGVVLTLDETPIGDFLEIEGDPEQIDRVAGALGFTTGAFEARSYLQIHRDEGGDGNMVFEAGDPEQG